MKNLFNNFIIIISTVLLAALSILIIFITLKLNSCLNYLEIDNLHSFITKLGSGLFTLLYFIFPLDGIFHNLALDSDYVLPDYKPDTILCMDSNESSSSETKWTAADFEVWKNDISNTLRDMFNTTRDMRRFQVEKGIRIFETAQGGLDIDGPKKMPDNELIDIGNKIHSLDQVFYDKLDHYKWLGKDKRFQEDKWFDSWAGLYDFVMTERKDVFSNKWTEYK